MPEPDADALQTTPGATARPLVCLVGMSASDIEALEEALRISGLSTSDASHLSAISAPSQELGLRPPTPAGASGNSGPAGPAALIFLTTDPLETASTLWQADAVEGPRALARWERFHRSAMEVMRGLPVFVTSRAHLSADPEGSSTAVSEFLARHAALPSAAGSDPLLHFAQALRAPDCDEDAGKDDGLVLASQLKLSRLLGQLLGPHECFDPPAPEPESPWVAAVLDLRRDLEQVWAGLDWATGQLASAQLDAGAGGGSEQPAFPLNASEDLPAYQEWLRAREEAVVLPLGGGLPPASSRPRRTASPVFSVVVPVYRPPSWALERCVASVLAQSFGRFQLVLADDASGDPALQEQLRAFARLDPRVEVVFRGENGGISAATNSAIGRARGEFVAFLDDDDELHLTALEKMATAVAADPDADVLYSDEDKLSSSGQRCIPTFKPDWSPDLLMSSAYLCHLLVVRRSLVEELGGLRPEFDGGQDYDLMLRATERARKVADVPDVLYHWRVLAGSASGDAGAKPWAFDAARRALESAVARRGFDASVEPHERYPGNFHVRRATAGEPLVTVVVSFRDEPATIARSCRSLLEAPGYTNFELLLVDRASELTETEVLVTALAGDPRVRVVSQDQAASNWALTCNAAAAEARGDLLLFLHNGLEARSEDWLAAMVAHTQRNEVGATGALLHSPDLSVQHAGLVLAPSAAAAHVQQGLPPDRPGYLLMAGIARNCSGVTGACLMTSRSRFEQLGGFDRAFGESLGGLDFCLRLRERDLLIVFTPLAELGYFVPFTESAGEAETDRFTARWLEAIVDGDPYHNVNLTHFDPYCRLTTEKERDLWRSFRSTHEVSSTS